MKERSEEKEDSTKKDPREIAKRRIEEAAEIAREAKIAETFGLTEAHMSVFNSAFAMYLEAKDSYEDSYRARRPETDIMLRMPLLNKLARSIVQSALRGKLTTEILRRSVENHSVAINAQADEIGPGRIVNAANYLSTKWLENPFTFPGKLEKHRAQVERILRE